MREGQALDAMFSKKNRATAMDKPFTVFRKVESVDALATLGTELQGLVTKAVADPHLGLVSDSGRFFFRVEIELTVDPEAAPTANEFSFTAKPLAPEEGAQ